MTRKKIIPKKESMREVNEIVQSEEKELKLKHPPILRDTGGAIGNLPVKSDEYKKWLEEKRKRNSLIGSEYVEAAPEYGTKFELLDMEVDEASEEQLDENKAKEAYNPSEQNNTPNSEEMGEAPIQDNTDNKYIDFCIVELSTKKLLGHSLEDIEKDALDEMKKHHDDEKYTPEIDVKQVIEITGQLLIENKKNENKEIEKPTENPQEDPPEEEKNP